MYYAACNGSVDDFYSLSEYGGATLSNDGMERLLNFDDSQAVVALCVKNGWFPEMPTREMQKKAHAAAERDNARIEELALKLVNGDPNAKQEILSAGSLVNEKETESGNTMLHICCRRGATSAARFLVEEAGARGDIRAHDGSTALVEAVRVQSLELIDLMLTRFPSSKNSLLDNSENAVFVAARMGSKPVLEKLLVSGCDCYQHRDDGMSCVMLASKKGHFEVLKSLIRYGVDPAMHDSSGQNAFDVAKTKEITQYLYEQYEQSDVND